MQPDQRSFRDAFGGVLVGGLVAGALDITYAMGAAALRGRSPARAVQAVASGVLGAGAFDGGATTFLFGLLLHFFIACSAAFCYFALSRHVALLRDRALVPGAIFGVLVYLVMNFVVLPLSAVPFKLSYPLPTLLLGLAVHVVFVGLPIALAVRRVWT